MNILITGITGNVGQAVYHALKKEDVTIIGGVRNVDKYNQQFQDIILRTLDFTENVTYHTSTEGIDQVFLVRPPQISDYTVINDFIDVAILNGVKHIVFLSLMGIEKNPFPPHRKIEEHLKGVNVDYTFLRPSFFMQNLLDTHLDDIKKHNDLFIPSGRAKLSFIDTSDIGLVGKEVLIDDKHRNQAYTLTGPEALSYKEVSQIMTGVLGRDITYSKPGLLKFRSTMLKRGYKKDFINVMLFLNIMTRLGTAKTITNDVYEITQKPPTTMKEFIKKNKEQFKKE